MALLISDEFSETSVLKLEVDLLVSPVALEVGNEELLYVANDVFEVDSTETAVAAEVLLLDCLENSLTLVVALDVPLLPRVVSSALGFVDVL